jgi:sec-independent protein translocase protein TatA
MGSFSIWHWIIVLVVVLLLFGRGKIPELMGDLAKGINSFKKGMREDESASAKTIEQKSSEAVPTAKDQSKAS